MWHFKLSGLFCFFVCFLFVFVFFSHFLCSTQESLGCCPAESSCVGSDDTATFQGSTEDSCNDCQADQTVRSVCGIPTGKKPTDNGKQNSPLNFPQSDTIRSDKRESGNVIVSSGDSLTGQKTDLLLTDEQGGRNAECMDLEVKPHSPPHKSMAEAEAGAGLGTDNEFTNISVTFPSSPIRKGQKEDGEEVTSEISTENEEVSNFTATECTILEHCNSVSQLTERADITNNLESISNEFGLNGAVTDPCFLDNTQECSVSLLACHTDRAQQSALCVREESKPVEHAKSAGLMESSVAMGEASDSHDSHSPSLLTGGSRAPERNAEVRAAGAWRPEEQSTHWNASSEAHSEPSDITPSLQISHTGLPHLDEIHNGETRQISLNVSKAGRSGGSETQRDVPSVLNSPSDVCISSSGPMKCDMQMSQLGGSSAKRVFGGREKSDRDLSLCSHPNSREAPGAQTNSSLSMDSSYKATMLSGFELIVNSNEGLATEHTPVRSLCEVVQVERPSGHLPSDTCMTETPGDSAFTETNCVTITDRVQTEAKVQELDSSSDSDCTMISDSECTQADVSKRDITENETPNLDLCPGVCSPSEMRNGNYNVPPNGSESQTFNGNVTGSSLTGSSLTANASATVQGLHKEKAKIPKQKRRQSWSAKSQGCWKLWQPSKTFGCPTDSAVGKGICFPLELEH